MMSISGFAFQFKMQKLTLFHSICTIALAQGTSSHGQGLIACLCTYNANPSVNWRDFAFTFHVKSMFEGLSDGKGYTQISQIGVFGFKFFGGIQHLHVMTGNLKLVILQSYGDLLDELEISSSLH